MKRKAVKRAFKEFSSEDICEELIASRKVGLGEKNAKKQPHANKKGAFSKVVNYNW